MPSRRKFLGAFSTGLLGVGYLPGIEVAADAQTDARPLSLTPVQSAYRPLDEVTVAGSGSGHLLVLDGQGRSYVDRRVTLPDSFLAGGALGTHAVLLFDESGNLNGRASFMLDAATSIQEPTGEFEYLLHTLYWTMASDGPAGVRRHNGRVYTFWDNWVLDNTNTLKGMRYFWPEVRQGFEIFSVTQREDGMIWENHLERTPPENYWDWRFKYADFSRAVDGGYVGLRRAPVENHVEAYFLEAFYLVWKTTGDDAWMREHLDHALHAVHYSTTDPYRWSQKYGLLKRGLTIDTWDFLCESEAALSGDAMVIDLKKTHFGVFYGDNTGFIAGCRYLAERLDRSDRAEDGAAMRKLAAEMEERLNRIAWNGRFYTHWVAEDPGFKPDLGVDMSSQVSLSNAYSLNRGIGPQQIKAIIETYQSIRSEMPSTSPGEFYSIYPPFSKGFGPEQSMWNYVNGGVLACTAGELARGCLQHGYEEYGAGILNRLHEITKRHRDFLPGILRGKQPERPPTQFTPVDLSAQANCDTGKGAEGVPGWVNDPRLYLIDFPTGRQEFRGVPFHIASSQDNGHRVCIGLSSAPHYATKVDVSVHQRCQCFYMLHACAGDALTMGKLTIHYADGSKEAQYIERGVNVGAFWMPEEADEFDIRRGTLKLDRMQIAWRGSSPLIENVGVWIASFVPRRADVPIAALEMESAADDSKWLVVGVTLSDMPPFLPPWNDVSTGMPNNWGAGCVTAALIEGLAGVEDTGAGLRTVRLTPRWLAAGAPSAEVTVRYPSSSGYCAYRYRTHERGLEMEFTGNAQSFEPQILLPRDRKAKAVRLDGQSVEPHQRTIEASTYLVLPQTGVGIHRLEVDFA